MKSKTGKLLFCSILALVAAGMFFKVVVVDDCCKAAQKPSQKLFSFAVMADV